MLCCWFGQPVSIKPWLKALDGSQEDFAVSERNFRLHAVLSREEGFASDWLL